MPGRVICIGEALIDFIPDRSGVFMKDVENFRRVCGGGPANVSAAIARLGGSASLVAKVGADSFGDYIKECLSSCGVDTQYVFSTAEAHTTLAFVTLRADGERDFSFYRNPGADMLLGIGDIAGIQDTLYTGAAALHFSTVDLIEAPVKYATKKAVEMAKNRGLMISFDPNVRLPLWDDPEKCRETALDFLPYADIVKISDNEVEFIYGGDTEAGIAKIMETAKICFYTMGSDGARMITKDIDVTHPALKVQAVDTTGAGDAFTGAVLCTLSGFGCTPDSIEFMPRESLISCLDFAQKCAAYSVTSKGAIDSYGRREQIRAMFG